MNFTPKSNEARPLLSGVDAARMRARPDPLRLAVHELPDRLVAVQHGTQPPNGAAELRGVADDAPLHLAPPAL